MNDVIFLNGQPVPDAHEDHNHISPVPVYVAVFVALLVLTVVTYGVSFADLGSASLPVAMAVATVKASLVVGYFMHLKYEDRFYAFLLACSMLFIGIFFTVVLLDVKASGDLNPEAGMGYKRGIDDLAEQLKAGK
jgi:cytochrome c oxidase subunit 4